MLPSNALVEVENKAFLPPRNKPTRPNESWGLGGVALSGSNEPFSYNWRCYVQDKAICIARTDGVPVTVLSFVGDVTEVSLAFDQTMRPVIAYVEDDVSKLYWYSSSLGRMTITEFDDIRNPRVSMDDTRQFNISNSDIIFAYVAGFDRLCYRLQRERYSIEHVLNTDDERPPINPLRLFDIGMGRENRFLFSTN